MSSDIETRSRSTVGSNVEITEPCDLYVHSHGSHDKALTEKNNISLLHFRGGTYLEEQRRREGLKNTEANYIKKIEFDTELFKTNTNRGLYALCPDPTFRLPCHSGLFGDVHEVDWPEPLHLSFALLLAPNKSTAENSITFPKPSSEDLKRSLRLRKYHADSSAWTTMATEKITCVPSITSNTPNPLYLFIAQNKDTFPAVAGRPDNFPACIASDIEPHQIVADGKDIAAFSVPRSFATACIAYIEHTKHLSMLGRVGFDIFCLSGRKVFQPHHLVLAAEVIVTTGRCTVQGVDDYFLVQAGVADVKISSRQ